MPVRNRIKAWLRRETTESPSLPQAEAPAELASAAQPETAEAAPATENVATIDSAPSPAANDNTRNFGDTTRSLASRAPQLVALLGERITGAAALRDIGRTREENQDHCFAQWINFPSDVQQQPLGLFIVADGMGGHEGGAEASRLTVQTVVETISVELFAPIFAGKSPTPQPVLQSAVQAANAAVYAAGQAAGNDMGTTCTVAALLQRDLIIAHVGDSRAILINGSQAKVLTTDHSAVGRLIAIGALTPEEAQEHPLRNQLYRTVGQHASVQVDVVTHQLRDETHLLLCSDGLWGLVALDDIVDIVTEAPSPESAARQLIARANLLGGHDNISAVVVALPTAEVRR